jgi:hypothetical protein
MVFLGDPSTGLRETGSMFDRNFVLRLAVVIFPLVGAATLASLIGQSEFPGFPALVFAILVGSVILVLMRSGRS